MRTVQFLLLIGGEEMLSLAFVGVAEDLVFYGPTGRGKTHMATAVGIAATSAGYPVRSFQTSQLVLQLGTAKRDGALDRLLGEISRARLLYQVISESCERRSMVLITNVEFSRWGTVFADDKLAAAIVGRAVHHGRPVEYRGPSHRLEESLMLGKSGG